MVSLLIAYSHNKFVTFMLVLSAAKTGSIEVIRPTSGLATSNITSRFVTLDVPSSSDFVYLKFQAFLVNISF